MKFVIAPDKFKGSLSSFEFCAAAEEGIKMISPGAKIIKLPLADGGDGTIEVMNHYLDGEKIKCTVNDPLFRSIEATYIFNADKATAFIEMAEASGYKLLKESERNCMYTSTLGTGEMILNAIHRGAENIILGIGGSSTNDCGIGMATVLGYKFFDDSGNKIKPIGKNLSAISRIEIDDVLERLSNINFQIACDVNNPLYGPNGAAKVYAKQKGASEKEIEILDKGLQSFSKIVKSQLGIDVQSVPGAGAAGGMGAASIVFLKAKLTPGIDLVKKVADFEAHLPGAHWVITGEGKLDDQTLSGKTLQGVLQSAKKLDIPVAAFCGAIEISEKDYKKLGLSYATSILNRIVTFEEAVQDSYQNLKFSVMNFVSAICQKKDE